MGGLNKYQLSRDIQYDSRPISQNKPESGLWLQKWGSVPPNELQKDFTIYLTFLLNSKELR